MEEPIPTPEKHTLTWFEHLACGWPLIMVVVGGALGGALGGGAYALSAALFRRSGGNARNYIYSGLIGVGAIVAYFVVLFALMVLFPGIFKK